jgi:membrane-associated phospholipid phosphatase
MKEPGQFRPLGPPALDSKTYHDAVERIAGLGDLRSGKRSADQTEMVHYWNDGAGTYGPPGHWNVIAAAFVQPLHLGAAVEAELFAELNVALSDGAVAAADSKYAYRMWRPVTAIRAGQADMPAIPDWTPLVETPNHPSYVSGHATFSGAAASVLTAWFGNHPFSSGSTTVPGVTRSFANFQAAAEEAASSRLFAGIHFDFDNAAGLVVGRAVGDWTMQRFKRIDEDRGPLLMIMDPAMAMGDKQAHGMMGCAVDNAAPITSVSVRLDDEAPFTLPVDQNGMFTLPANQLGRRRHAEVTAISGSGRSSAIRVAVD